MLLRLNTLLPGAFSKSSKRSGADDLELASLLPNQSRPTAIDLKTLLGDERLVTKLYEAPTSHLDGSLIATPRPTTRKGSWFKTSWLMTASLLLVAPAISASIYGAIRSTHPAHPDHPMDVAACIAGVCAGFSVPRFAYADSGDNSTNGMVYKNTIIRTQVDEKENCLAFFYTGVWVEDWDAILSFDHLPVFSSSGFVVAERPCDISTLEGPIYPRNRRFQHSAFQAGVIGAALAEAGLIGKLLFQYKKGATKHWLSDSLRARLSPHLYTLVTNFSSLSEDEQQQACHELIPVLQNLLIEGVERFDEATVDALLALGVSPSAAEDGKKSALEISLSRRSDALSLKLVAHTTALTAAHLDAAARVADIDTVVKILEQVQTQTDDGQQPLQELLKQLPDDFLFALSASAQSENTDLSVVLQALGDDVKRFLDARDSFGRTPLHIASFWQRNEQTNSLIAHGADNGLTDIFGKTPQDLASLRA